MKAIVVKGNYGLENIAVEEIAIPIMHKKDVLLKVKSVSLNQLDLMIAKGAFGTNLPHILGSDAVGIIETIGSEVTSLKVGDIVSSHFIQNWHTGEVSNEDLNNRLGTNAPGVFSEFVALPESSLVKIPKNLTYEESATLPMAGLTAWEGLVNAGKLKSGQTVLLQGTGGVSIFALQFAKALGAKVIMISSSDDKLNRAKLLGADEIINYSKIPDWQKQVHEITNGRGVDLALEMSWTEIGKTIEAMKLGGKIVIVGLMGGAKTEMSVFGIIQKSLSILGIQVGSIASFEAMNKAIEINNIKPVIDRVFNLHQLPEALAYFNEGKHFGKVVLNF